MKISKVFVNVSAEEVTSGTLDISTNGTFDVSTYKNAKVAVPASVTDTLGTKTITANGEIDVVGYSKVSVNVSNPVTQYTNVELKSFGVSPFVAFGQEYTYTVNYGGSFSKIIAYTMTSTGWVPGQAWCTISGTSITLHIKNIYSGVQGESGYTFAYTVSVVGAK